jgi:prepilin-type processing-associated H-X9-DG protein
MATEIALVLDTEGTSLGSGYDMRGLYWNNVHMNTLAVTARPPNASAGDVIGWSCRNIDFAPCASSSTSGNVMTPRSRHPGGAHCLFADGSVSFVANTINTDTFQHLGTNADGEVASVP